MSPELRETYGRGRVTNPDLDQRLKRNRDKKRPADASGATQPSNGLGRDPVPSDARSGGKPHGQYSESDMLPSRPGIFATETEFDRLQKRVGLAELENEVLRDLLDHTWGIIGILSSGERNAPAEALRARIWAHLHDEEAECPNCDHYVVNHAAAGPCAVAGCECQNNADYRRRDANGTPSPSPNARKGG